MYRKLKAGYLFDGKTFWPENTVLVTEENGTIVDLVNNENAGSEIEIYDGMLIPGFINGHCHLELSHLKGFITEGGGLVDFVQQIMSKRNINSGKIQEAMKNAEQEMYETGVAAVGDICNTAHTIPVKQKSNIYWHNFIEVAGFVESDAEKRLGIALDLKHEFEMNLLSNTTTVCPHAPYSVSKKLFQLINRGTINEILSIHNQECEAENELYFEKEGDFLRLYKNLGIDVSAFNASGKSSLQSWLPNFTNQSSFISVHNTFINQSDIDFIKNKKEDFYYCLCPNANQYIEQRMPPIELLRKNNCTLVLGTDSYASNRQLNILEEIKTIQRETHHTIPLDEILTWATFNGAKALGIENRFGSFEKNKKPGIVCIENMNHLSVTEQSIAKRIL